MTLSEARAVGFAVAGSAPADARQWITIDMAGFPGSERRGYIVATEPLNRSWHGIELANRAREIILTELRRLKHLDPDEALGRSMAAANGIVVSQNHDAAMNGHVDDVSFVGVSAIVLQDNLATIAHVPPGQMILVEDGLVYTVPEFQSWFPDYTVPESVPNQAEPLGFASWTAPLMAQTEVRAGDTFVFCTSVLGRAYIEEAAAAGYSERDMVWMHHRDPDKVLDLFKEVVIAAEIPSAAAAVISFPPLPNMAQTQTLADVRLRARDTMLHSRAIVGQLRPAKAGETVLPVSPPAEDLPEPIAQAEVLPEGEPIEPPSTRIDLQERMHRVFEPKTDKAAGWRQRPPAADFGVPGRHGVDLYRTPSQSRSEAGWRHNLPRLPIIGSAWIWPLLFLVIAGLATGGLWWREEFRTPPIDPDRLVARIDEQILAARELDDSSQVLDVLDLAQADIERAMNARVPDDVIAPRQLMVTEMRDDETHVVRMSDVQRIGSLPDEFGDATVQGAITPAGVFFVAGSLYQYRPNVTGDAPDLVMILQEGDTIGETTIGALWGVAFDARGLYATDGETVFMLPVESQEWRAVRLGRINNQPWEPGPLAAFDGSVYLLQAEYRQIYRFQIAASATDAQPVDWLLTGARDSADHATDIAIDGNIYMLISDGTMQQLRLGDLQREVKPDYVGEDQATSLVGRGGWGYLYQAVLADDSGDSRIIAFDVDGEHASQLMLPIGFSTGDANVADPFDEVQDIVVEESSGTIYIINRDGIWTARFSLPPLPADPTETDVEADAEEGEDDTVPVASPTALTGNDD